MLRVQILCRGNFILRRSVKIKCIRRYSILPRDISKGITPTYQPIADFYAGKSVFITGGTGILGKVFLEKLLYSCKELDKIYLLVREKDGVNVNKRIEDMLENPFHLVPRNFDEEELAKNKFKTKHYIKYHKKNA